MIMPVKANKPEMRNVLSFKKEKTARKMDRRHFSGRKAHENKNPWIRSEAQRWYVLLGLSVIVSILLFPNVLMHPKQYKPGDIADRDIKAPREFLVENKELTETNRQETVKAVLSIYDFDPTGAGIVEKIREGFSFARKQEEKRKTAEKTSEETSVSVGNLKNRFFEMLETVPVDTAFTVLMERGFPKEAEENTINFLTRVYRTGVVSNKMMLMSQSSKGIILHDINRKEEMGVKELERFHDLKAAKTFIKEQGDELITPPGTEPLIQASIELALAMVQPNLTFNNRETELRKDTARKSVSPFYFKVKKGEMLVREGERITPEHLLKLSELNKYLKQKNMLGSAPAMAILIGFLLSAMYLVGLLNGRWQKVPRKDLLFWALTLLIIFSVAIAYNFVAAEIARGFPFFTPRALLFGIPIASGVMLISIFQGMGVAVSFSLIVSVLTALVVGGRVEFFIYFLTHSLVAAYGVQNCRERGVLITTGLKVGVINIALALAIEALYGSFYSLEALVSSIAALAGGILVGVIATGILPLFEMAFGYTTDIKLLELANLDQPLLRELMIRCPGSHHHSVIVSNMVEATAKAIDANPLLAKVAAYYHDIGKMKKPLYFIENQGDSENRHEKLAPSMSSLVLISHLKDGAELAKKHKLGKEIIDIIRQHHGTSLISFFYEKARESRDKKGGKTFQIKEEDFRYPGPKPQTKEAGLVMLADVVEAASRTLVDPTAARIQGMVQRIVNKVFADGQLDECELTLRDLHVIARSFNKTLTGIFHHRVEYPGSVTAPPMSKKYENGHSDQLSTADSRVGRSQDQVGPKENLKRLGLSRQ